VLVADVVALVRPTTNGVYVDATVGLGGHAQALLEAGAGRVIGIDRDPDALQVARTRLGAFGPRVELVHAEHGTLAKVLDARGVSGVQGVVADLGVSSMQLDQADRGFSFRQKGPLDMRMDPSTGPTLLDRLEAVDEATLANVIWHYGEERRSRRVARLMIEARDRGALTDTAALAAVVRRGVGARNWQRVDPATRTFQALRIWINDEIDGLGRFLQSAWSALGSGGRLAVIAFHSLEDRVVKQTFRTLSGDQTAARLLTTRPIVAGDEERARNPRARSARLRGVEKLA
jgi:16S rRNA (cytosine1402-N4)-methyltransferase